MASREETVCWSGSGQDARLQVRHAAFLVADLVLTLVRAAGTILRTMIRSSMTVSTRTMASMVSDSAVLGLSWQADALNL